MFPLAQIHAYTSLHEVVSHTLTNSDSLKAQQLSEKVSEEQVGIAQTRYFPDINAEALDSTGFAGSNSGLSIGGVMGSPFRSGYAYGLTATQQIFDFGKTSAKMNTAKKSFETQKSRTEVKQWSVKEDAINLYFACARVQTQAKLWTAVEGDSKGVQKEVERFVSTGQRSVVDGLLAKAQTEESTRNKSSYLEELSVLLDRIELLSGISSKHIDCPNLLDATLKAELTQSEATKSNPYLLQAEAEKNEAEARVREARSGYMPQLLAVGSVGDMQKTRLVTKYDYSAGIGLVLPLFDGLRTPREVQGAHALQTQKETEVGAAHQFVDDVNLKFDQMIRSDQTAIDHLHQELMDSDKAFRVARERYISFSGSLVDVRESIRNFSQLRSQFIDVQADWQRAISLKAAFNGQEL